MALGPAETVQHRLGVGVGMGVAVAVAMGMGLSAAPQSLYLFPDWVTTIFGKAPVVVASMIAISLNQILPKRHGNPTT